MFFFACSPFYILAASRFVTFKTGNLQEAFQISTDFQNWKKSKALLQLTERHINCSRFTVDAKTRKSPRDMNTLLRACVGTKVSLACVYIVHHPTLLSTTIVRSCVFASFSHSQLSLDYTHQTCLIVAAGFPVAPTVSRAVKPGMRDRGIITR